MLFQAVLLVCSVSDTISLSILGTFTVTLTCGRVLKSAEIRKKYKLKADICLPVILSKKKGKDALELCTHPDKHGDMSAACHKRPGNFRIDQVYKDHSRKATSDELETANWAPAKKGKN